MIAFQRAVLDPTIALFLHRRFRAFLVHPGWESPHRGRYGPKMHGPTDYLAHALDERIVECLVIQKHVGIVEPSIEPGLERLDRVDRPA